MKLKEALSHVRSQMLDTLVLDDRLQLQQWENGDVNIYMPDPFDPQRSRSITIPAEHLKAAADYLLAAHKADKIAATGREAAEGVSGSCE